MRGSYSIAHEIAAKALAVKEKALGLDDQQTLTSLEVLESVLQDQGNYDEAEKLNRRALEGSEKELGGAAPFYADEREQPGGGAAGTGKVRGSREAQPASAGREGEGAWEAAPRYADFRLLPRSSLA
ncbi:hypothetical protein BU23DRAFT_641442, partial [Bimuria novae-zelandiae CBS 107.79]